MAMAQGWDSTGLYSTYAIYNACAGLLHGAMRSYQFLFGAGISPQNQRGEVKSWFEEVVAAGSNEEGGDEG